MHVIDNFNTKIQTKNFIDNFNTKKNCIACQLQISTHKLPTQHFIDNFNTKIASHVSVVICHVDEMFRQTMPHHVRLKTEVGTEADFCSRI